MMNRPLCSLLSIALFLLIPAAGCPQEDAATSLRVCVIDDRPKIDLSLRGPYKIFDINSKRLFTEGRRLHANVGAVKGGLSVGAKELKGFGVKVKVSKDSTIYVNGRRFRGDIDIIKKDDGKLSVINNIGLENYLYGVLYHEISHKWPQEVVKAQAIAARTFAVYQKRQNRLQPYDLRSDIYSQMYGGRTSEKWSTNKAVDATRGEILVFNGDILPAYYHATCAGRTEDASNLWKVDLAPLKGVDCAFCKDSPHYRWVKEVPLWVLADKLRENGYKIGKVVSVRVLSRNSSGRVDKLEIKDDSGTSVILTGKDFRQMLGPNEARSTNFDASIRWGLVVLEGRGWGHGVGMCQWGAYGMAREGRSAKEILAHYYPGTQIATIDSIKDKL